MVSSLQSLLDGEVPVLIDFTATWCGPCKMQAPILTELKKDLGDAVRVIRIDIDKNPQVATAFQVQSVPTIIIFKEGKPLWRQSGVQSKHALIQAIKSV
jgi:thioredoxin 1